MTTVAVKTQTTLTSDASSQHETSEQVLLRKQDGNTRSLEIFRDSQGYVRGRVRDSGKMQEVPVLGTPRTVELVRVPTARHSLAHATVNVLPYGIEVRPKLLGGMPRTDDLEELLAIAPSDRPTPYEYALLSSAVYKSREAHEVAKGLHLGPVANPIHLPESWKVLQISDERWDSYFGVAYQKESIQHIVIAHRGTNPSDLGNLLTDVEGIIANRRTGHQEYAWEFTKEVIKNFENEGYTFSCTGHSLGAWLAQVCVLYGKGTFNAVTFDDPGCQEMLAKRQTEALRYETVWIEDCDIVNYLSRPNPINTFNHHAGSSYRLSSELLENLSLTSPVEYTKQSHSLNNIIACFDPETGMPREQQLVKQFPLYGRSFLNSLSGSNGSLLQRFGTFFTGTLSNLIKEGIGHYADYNPQELHRRNFPASVRRFLTDKNIPNSNELPTHPSLSKEQMRSLLKTLLKSHEIKLDGTIEITDPTITALDFRRILAFLLSGPSHENVESAEVIFTKKKEDPSVFSAQKLLQGLNNYITREQFNLELSRRFEQYKGELQGNVAEINLAREDLLELACLAVKNSQVNVSIQAVDLLIRSLEEDRCMPEGTHGMITIYSALYRKMGEVMVALTVSGALVDILIEEKLTRIFAIALKKVNMYRTKGFVSPQSPEGSMYMGTILEEVQKLKKLIEDSWRGKDIKNSVWKRMLQHLTGQQNVEMFSSNNEEVRHNLNSIAKGLKLLAMNEQNFKTATDNARELIRKTLETGKKLAKLSSALSWNTTQDIPLAIQDVFTQRGWSDFLRLKQTSLFSENSMIASADSINYTVKAIHILARDTINGFRSQENWYLKTLLAWDFIKSIGSKAFLIVCFGAYIEESGANIEESEDNEMLDWHYEKIAFLQYVIKHTAPEDIVQEIAVSTLLTYFEPRVWQKLSNAFKVKPLIVGKRFPNIGELQLLLAEIKRSKEYDDDNLEKIVNITAQSLELECYQEYWRTTKTKRRQSSLPIICKYTPPVQTFTGRKILLKQIKQVLRTPQIEREIPTAVVLSGLGGVGKTQLATKFIQRHAHLYNLIWTFEAESTETLNQSYRAFATQLELVRAEEKGVDVEEIRDRVLGYLQKPEHHGWLLYFDNAEDPKGLEKLFPPYGGRVLITARQSSEWEKSTVISVDEFTEEEAIELLEKLISQNKRDRNSVRELAKVLGGFPLALSQAGGCIESEVDDLTTKIYLGDFYRERQKLWEGENPSKNYPNTIATTWTITMNRIRKNFPESAEILNICAYLNADGIPLTWLKNWLQEKTSFSGVQLRSKFRALIGPLRNFALLREEVPLKTLRIHRLVQLVTQDGSSPEEKKESLEKAQKIVLEQFSKDNKEEGLPHAISVANHALAFEKDGHLKTTDLTQTASLLHEIGRHLNDKENASEAKGYLEKALRIKRAAYGKTNPSVVQTLIQLAKAFRGLREYKNAKKHLKKVLEINPENDEALHDLGRVHYDWCKFEEAKKYYEIAIEQKKVRYGSERHPSVAVTLDALGRALSDLGKKKEAIVHFEKAMEIFKAVHHENDPSAAMTLNNLGFALSDLGQKKDALDRFEKALEIFQFYGENHPNVANTLNNLGLVYSDLGQKKKAIVFYEKARKMFNLFYGENYPNVANTLNNLGIVYSDLGQKKKAIAFYEKALEIFNLFYGESHPKIAETLKSLGIVWSDLGKKNEAITYHMDALIMYNAFYGNSHPSVAETLNALGQAHRSLGENEQAIIWHTQALDMYKTFYGDSHPSVAETLNALGQAHRSLGKNQQAIEHHTQALDMYNAFYGNSHLSVAETLNALGQAYRSLGENQQAIEHHTQALDMYKHFYGDSHPSVAETLNALGQAYRSLDENQQAIEYHQTALTMFNVFFGESHPDVAFTLHNLGTAQNNLNQNQQAIDEYYEKALQMRKDFFGDKHPSVADTLNNLGIAWSGLGEKEKAIENFEKALKIYTSTYGENHPSVALTLNNLGTAWSDLGQKKKATELYEKALQIYEEFHDNTARHRVDLAQRNLEYVQRTCTLL